MTRTLVMPQGADADVSGGGVGSAGSAATSDDPIDDDALSYRSAWRRAHAAGVRAQLPSSLATPGDVNAPPRPLRHK